MFNRVLLVDDSKSARFALRKLLEHNGLTVDMAANAEEALGYLDDNHPDVIFMDHFMPGMDGFEAAQAIKSRPAISSIPIVMCTSKDDADYIEQARAHGAADILPKPATPHALNMVLDNLHATVAAMTTEQPVNEPEFYTTPESDLVHISEDEPLLDALPTLDEVVVPAEEVRDVARQAVYEISEQMVAEQVSQALESKLPELRELVMLNFDTVVKTMIKGYMADAQAQAMEQFNEKIDVGVDAQDSARQVNADAVAESVKAQVLVVHEQMEKELTEQISEIYSTIGEIKANNHLKKIAPELMDDILERAGDRATEHANDALLQVSEIAYKSAEQVSGEMTGKAMAEMQEQTDNKITRSLESGFESIRQEAAEIAWQKVAQEKAELLGAIDKLRDRSALALCVGLLAVAAAAFNYMF